jgi:hypothetical protein
MSGIWGKGQCSPGQTESEGEMFIRHFGVRNYGIHRETDIDLFPVTILLGANNSGKSALFDSLLNFSMLSRGKLSEAFGAGPFSFSERISHGAPGAGRIGFTVHIAESVSSEEYIVYNISYGHAGGVYTIFDEEITSHDGTILFDRRAPDKYPMGEVHKKLETDKSIFAAIRQSHSTKRTLNPTHSFL